MFQHELWNLHECFTMDTPRTTNELEGWDKAFSKSLGRSHATIWTLKIV